MKSKAVAKKILEWIYPPRCMLCSDIIPLYDERFFCHACKGSMELIKEPFCVVCGAPLADSEKCGECRSFTEVYVKNCSLFVYENKIVDVMHKIKYSKRKDYAKGLGLLMGVLLTEYFAEDIDCIIPIPLHKDREKSRGFNQALELALSISEKSGIPVYENALKRVKNTNAQYNLSAKLRMLNVEDAFALSDSANINNKKILLVDDIYTTGSTINECAKVLLNSNAESVSGYTLARALFKNSKNINDKAF